MTLAEVARRAKVSTTTVSRVLNQSALVNAATRKAVERAIRELNFHPNLHARVLAAGKSRSLGLVVSNLENPFFLDIFRAMEEEAHQHGYEVTVQNTGYDRARLVAAVHQVLQFRAAGVAIIVSEMEPGLQAELAASRMPVVIYDVGEPGPHVTSIKVNYERGIRKAVDYLYALGHRRMAFVGHHPGLKPLQGRREAFLATMEEFGGRIHFALAMESDDPAGGQRAARVVLAARPRPSAILCANDFMAMGVLGELREQRLQVPAEISVVGYDNIGLAQFAAPPLTTLDIPRETIGRMAFHALTVEGGGAEGAVAPPRDLRLEPELVVRASTAPPPK
ncbi:MAG: LacI family DNA-binding transcriptional regulator [Terriglobales bacterium]